MRAGLPLVLAALALAGCATELGSQVDERGFGEPTLNNLLVMTGQRGALQQLGERFAREVPDTVHFEFDRAVLDAEAQAILRAQADWIRQFPEVRFRVFGHTDLVGTQAYNRALGLRRAQAVVSYLATQGISRSRLEAVASFGETRPLIQTADPERRNRRTVTEVTGFVERHPTLLHGKYAEVVFREYIRGEAGAVMRHPRVAAGRGAAAGQ